jgi:DnaK suppressor protein
VARKAAKPDSSKKKTSARAAAARARGSTPTVGLDGKKSKAARVARPSKDQKPALRRGQVEAERLRGKATAQRKSVSPRPSGRARSANAQVESVTVPREQTEVATYLTPEEIEEFRRMLLEKRAQLLGDVGTLQDEALRGSRREAAGDLSSMPVHMADLGTDNYELEFTLGLLEGGRESLREIDEALERIRKGTFGVCVATGKPIGKARLRAKPWAKYCYEYALALEKGRHRGS